MLAALFIPGPGSAPACADACDTNDDGQANIADPIALLEWLFAAHAARDLRGRPDHRLDRLRRLLDLPLAAVRGPRPGRELGNSTSLPRDRVPSADGRTFPLAPRSPEGRFDRAWGLGPRVRFDRGSSEPSVS